MWLAKKLNRAARQESSIGQAEDGAVIGRSLRSQGVYCLPYGYYALPGEGCEVLLTQADDRQICCGVLASPPVEKGEVLIRGEGGGYIRLCRDGRVILGGRLCREDGSEL